MRILKKTLSLLMVVAMVFSLVTVVADASPAYVTMGSASINSGAEAQDVTVKLLINNTAETNLGAFKGTVTTSDSTNVAIKSITANAGLMGLGAFGSVVGNNFSFIAGAPITFAEDYELLTIVYTVAADAPAGDYTIGFEIDPANTGVSALELVTVDSFSGTITVKETATINSVTAPAAIADKALGTAVADLGLPSTVVVETATKASPVGQSVNVTWDTAAYDATSLADQTFTGTVTTGNELWTLADDFVAPTITVTLQPLTAGDITADIAEVIEIPAEKEAREVTSEELLALFDDVTYTITSGDFAEEIEVTGYTVADVDFDITVVDTTKTVTATFAAATDSENGKFVLAEEATLTFTVKVVPAEIEGCTIAIKDTTATSKPTVKATIPANEVTGEATVAVEFLKAVTVDETTTWEVVATEEATVTAEADVDTVVAVKASKTLEEMGFKNPGDVFAVKVLVNGATLLVDGAEQVESKVMVKFSDDVPGIGNSQGNVSVVVPSKPGTEEPGTEEPGTEEPGTEEPGTEEPAVDAPFADITEEYAWAAEAITTLKDLGVINGKDDNNFAPDADITRAEFTKMVAVLFGLEVAAADTHFADCAADAWYTPYIVAATEAGFINGVNDAEFAPDATITREQACTILGRALKVAGEAELSFTDAAEIADYAKAAIAALVDMGILNGYEDGSFAPVNNITRAEAAKIMAGAYAKIAPAEEVVAE